MDKIIVFGLGRDFEEHKETILREFEIIACTDNYVVPQEDCKIDVEGFEKEVLQGCDFNIFRPWIFVIEAVKPGTAISCHEKMGKYSFTKRICFRIH